MHARSGPGGVQTDIAAAYDLAERGVLKDAEAAARRAIGASAGQNPAAWTVLGVVLRQAQRSKESEAAYREALRVAPAHAPAHHDLGALLSNLERAEEALASLDRAAALGLKAPELLVNRGKTLAQLYRLDEAEGAYLEAVTLDNRNTSAQSSLAQLRYMRGDPFYARDIEAAARQHPLDFGLQTTHGEIRQRAGDLAGAESVLRTFLLGAGPVPEARSLLASVLHDMGRLKEAETEALEGAIQRPNNTPAIVTLVAIELALGQPDAAWPFIQAQRQRRPLAQRWIAYAAIAARMMGDPLYEKLYDYRRFVRVYEVEPPPGFRSIAELNAALVDALAARHRFAGRPLDQSLRNGRQTARSLVTDDDPAIQGLLSAFQAPLEDYRASVGNGLDHPLTARNRGDLRLRGCWSIELRRDGFHLNHIHPAGWLSSAYYVSVPAEVQDPELKSGWIKFGEPRLAVPGIRAAHFVQPRAGRLVLFPSYMWHGTNAIQGDDPRLTVAFDAAPVAGPGQPSV